MQVISTPSGYEISFDYNPRIITEIKELPGRYWKPSKKCWVVPLSEKDAVEHLMKKYGATGSDEAEVYGEIPPLPDLTIDLQLKRPPFPFQAKGIAQGLIYKRFINGDQPGLGKTTQAIGTVIGAKCKCILVICPASLKFNWQREFEIVAGMKSIVLTDKVKNTWQQYYKVGMCNVFITNYESLKKYFVKAINKPKEAPLRLNHIEFKDTIDFFDAVIIDELHRCKDGATQQSKFVMGIAKGKEYIIGLTGTPVVNKPKDLISQLHIIGRLKEIAPYKQFLQRYCAGGSGAANLNELHYKLSTTCFYQRQKKEVLSELPDKMRQIVLCDINNRKEYEDALNDLAAYLKEYREKTDPEIQRSMQGEMMVKIGICKNISARGKLADVTEFIDEVIGAGEKIVVFIHQREIARALLQHYPTAVSITGADDMDSRQKNVDKFQNDPSTKIIVCSIKAAGVGITLTASSRVAFVELPWHAADTDQCEDRCHRIGQKGSVQCTYFLGKDTIDEYIYELIENKRSIANTITGSTDITQRDIIDKVANSLFGSKNQAQQTI